jgi:thiol-disulfide isomerase/thioredoxin
MTGTRSPWLRRGLVALVLASALGAGIGLRWALGRGGTLPAEAIAALYGTSLPDAAGAPQSLAQYRGKLLVVNFWATWCAPCIGEMPDLQKIQDEYAARGVNTVGIAIDRADAVRDFQQHNAIRYPLLVAGLGGSELLRMLGNDQGALPYTAVLGPAGELVAQHLGAVSPDELRHWLDSQLKHS